MSTVDYWPTTPYCHHHTNQWAASRFIDSTVDHSLWKTTSTQTVAAGTARPKRYVPLPWNLNNDDGLWALNATTSMGHSSNDLLEHRNPMAITQHDCTPWTTPVASRTITTKTTPIIVSGSHTSSQPQQDGPPSVIFVFSCSLSNGDNESVHDDCVSELNDDPDHDDDDILPQPTYDVLVTLFQDIEDDEEHEHGHGTRHNNNYG